MKKIIIALGFILSVNIAFPIDLYWQVDPYNFENSMSVTASIYIDDIEQQNEMYELGAFCGEEVRGSALPRISNVTGKYIYSITIYGDVEDELLSFKFYDHSSNSLSELLCSQTLPFEINGMLGDANNTYAVVFTEPNPTFIGNGSWMIASNWKNSKMPVPSDDVIIDGTAYVLGGDDVTVNSLIINEGKSLTLENGAVLTVIGVMTNDDVDAFIIEEGGQVFQTNDNVAATFRNHIFIPDGIWGLTDETGWQFVSSPMHNSLLADFEPESGDYDLFRYESTLEYEWYNLKKAVKYDFNDGMDAVVTKDVDGDLYDWMWSEEGYVYSESYDIDNDEELSPDNYLIFPMMNPELDGEYLSFMVRAEDDFYQEYCGVAVSYDGESFMMLENASWTIGEGINEGEPSQWYEKVVDLSDYKGNDIYVAIRHYNVTGSYMLLIDNVKFYRNGGEFESGRSYLVSYETESVAEFKGFLNNETSCKMTANYIADDEEIMTNYSLFGNPFAYDIDWLSDVKLVGMNQGYAKVKADGGYEYKTDGVIKVGEGFMVNSAKGRSHNVTMQKGINSSKDNDNLINVTATSKYGSDNVILVFDDNNDSGFQKLPDFNEKIANIFVRENDTTFAIYNYASDVKEIVLYFMPKEMSSCTLTFDMKNEFESLYLFDRMTGENVDLLMENEYEFIGSPSDLKDRFILSSIPSSLPSTSNGFAYITNGEIIVNDINGNAHIEVFDVLGRCVYSNDFKTTVARIRLDGCSTGTFIIRKTDEYGVKNQKIVF